MADRLPTHILKHIKNAIQSAGLTNASFDMHGGKAALEALVASDSPTRVTDFIRERVGLHHRSWIIGPLESVLEWSKDPDDMRIPSEYDILGRLRAPLPNPDVLEEAYQEIVTLRARLGALERYRDSLSAARHTLEADTKDLPQS
jgi:hypothetical protein